MQADDPVKLRATLSDLLATVWRYARPSAWRTLFVVALGAVLEGVGLVLLVPVAETIFRQDGSARSGITSDALSWMERIGLESVLSQLSVMGVVFVLLVALRSYVLLKRDVLLMELSQGFVDEIRFGFFVRLARADWPVIKRYRKSELLNTMTTNIGRLSLTMRFLSTNLVLFALGLSYLVAAFVVSAALGLALLTLVALGLVSAVAWTRRSHGLGHRLNMANRGVMRETTVFLDGLKAAKVARAERELSDRFAASIAETRAISVEFVEQQARLRNAVQLISSVAALGVLLVGFALVGLSGSELLVMAAIVMRLAPNLIATFGGMQSIAHALPAFEAIRATERELEAAHKSVEGTQSAVETPIAVPGDAPILLRDATVEVSGPDGQRTRLVRVDKMEIGSGTLVHVGGPSGAGKSTMVELVAGLHLPSTGSVMRGDVVLCAASRAGWQQAISFAPQEPFIFDGTVRENLLWPNLEVDDAAIWRALDAAEARSIVEGLPAGLDEGLLDGGARLSGGERQRLCLARALLRPADLLILDEATSALDPELERRIVGRLRESIGRRIVLMVSHSLNAVQYADMRVEVAHGEARIAG